MSKAEFFHQLESLTPDELNKVAVRVEELRQRLEVDDVSETEKAILDERIARAKVNPGRNEEWPIVRERVLGKLQK
jgi:hypothetical protein